MKPYSWFLMGAMSGVILVLGYALMARDNAGSAYAQTALSEGQSGLLVASGGVLQSTNDIFWVLYKRPPTEKERKILGKNFEGPDRLTLCTYRVMPGGGHSGQGRVVLIGIRDITYDLKLLAGDQDTYKSIQEILKLYETATK